MLAKVHDTRTVTLIDAPAMSRPMRLRWAKHCYVCREHLCDQHTFTKTDPRIASPGHVVTRRATSWAITQLRREHASIKRAGPATRHLVEDVVAGHRARPAGQGR